jgi:Zn-dependent peptidase ImmA (M78 family)
LEIGDRELQSLSDLISAIRLDGRNAEQSVLEWKNPYFYETLVATNDREAPGFAINSRSERRKKFALCRGLFEYLTTTNGEPMLVTKEHTDRQKRNRAFAAEFLAPSDLLKRDISESYVDEDMVESLAQKYGVSPMLIAHQIENHDIANRVDTPF